MRHKINKILYASVMACFLSTVIFFTGCTPTGEVSLTPVLSVFGPSPALRGGELKFIGSNLDKVTAIVLAGNLEITEITKTSSTEISIVIPQNAVPGTVILKYSGGEITTKTPLTFSEPISIDETNGYTTATVKAGDIFTINGDYLNLIAQVIFTDGAMVDSADFISQTRKKIEVFVPKTAKTGKVAISNGAEIPVLVYTSGVATVMDPTTLTAIAPIPVKPGSDLTITGTYMDLIKTVILPDGNKIDSANIAINAAKTQITVKVPLTAKEGKVKVQTYSGTEMIFADSMKLVGPSITSVSPMLVKNGGILTVTGTNLDLVTGATFTDGIAGTLGTLSTNNTSLEITVPMTAVDGTVVLGTNSGLTATSTAITFVKPTFTSISPLSLTAGETVTITGTDLDLVRKVKFIGDLSVNVSPAVGAASIDVIVPASGAGTGSVTLETVNGTQVVSADQLVIIAATTPAITSVTTSVKPGGLMTITGKNLNYVESIIFPTNVKAVLYGVRSENTIEVYVPETAKKGTTTFTMNSFDGKEIVSPTFTISGTDPVVDASYVFFNFDGKNSWWGDKGAVENLAEYSLDGSSYFRINDNMNPWWTGLFWRNGKNDLKTDGVTVAGWSVKMDVNVIEASTGDFKFRFKGTEGDFWAVIPGFAAKGGWYTVTIPLTSFNDAGKLMVDMSTMDSDFGMAYAGPGEHVNMCIDNIRFEQTSGPSGVLRLY
jgi:hypothetical protein